MAQLDSVHLAYLGVLLAQAREQANPIVTDDIYRTDALQQLLYDELPRLLDVVRHLKFPAATYAEEVVAARRAEETARPRVRGKARVTAKRVAVKVRRKGST
jgi:hypothetical protein